MLTVPQRLGWTDGQTERQTGRRTDGRLKIAIPRSALPYVYRALKTTFVRVSVRIWSRL